MFKLIVPLVFVLLADGKMAGGAGGKAAPAHDAPRPIATERVADPKKGSNGAVAAAASGSAGAKKAAPGAQGDKHEVASEGGRALTAGTSGAVSTPPGGVSAPAWREEMGVRAGNQKAVTERERLEALSSDLAKTRTALREETTRLEGLMERTRSSRTGVASAGASPTTGAGAPAGASAAAVASGGGSGMGIGDPMAPNAYYRPAPPPPNFAIQVEVVSKAMKSMKPEQAAGILAHLERGLAAEVLQRMRPADAGAILGFLKPEVGAVLAAEIVSRPPVGGSRSKDSDKEKP